VWPWVMGFVVIIGVYGAVSAVRLLQAASHIETGIKATQRARAEATVADLQAGRPTADVQQAAAQFGRASSLIDGAWFDPVSVLPYIGRQLASTRAIASAATTVTRAAADALPQVSGILSAPHATAAERVTLVERLSATLATLDRRTSHLDLGPTRNLLDTLAAKRDAFQGDVDRLHAVLQRASAATSAVATLLRGPGTYLVLAANNAEMRDGSGMFLQAGTVTISQGAITVGAFTPTGLLSEDQQPVPISGDLKARWGQQMPNSEWRNLALSPQLPLNAPVAAAMWEARSGQHVDGVITVDVSALAEILQVTGPVTVAGTTYSYNTVEQQLLIDQYSGIGFNDPQNALRHEQLGGLATAALAALQQPGLSVSALSQALDDAANGRHLMVWGADPAMESQWAGAGVGGSVAPDGILLGLINQGANKLDPFEKLDATLTATAAGADTRVTVQVTVHNDAPGSLSRYAGDGTPGPRLAYNGCFALDLPSYAGNVTHQGGGGIEAEGRDGPSDVLAVAIAVPRRGVGTMEWQFTLAGHHGSLLIEPSARLPGTAWTVSLPGVSTSSFDDLVSQRVSW
jgi:Protein of unknown function (DUF4012)